MQSAAARRGRRLAPPQASTFAADVLAGLTNHPKTLPSRYLYDPLGLALFEAICELPWYGLTRAERRLLEQHSGRVFDELDDVTRIVVLGAGNGEKIRSLIQTRPPDSPPVSIELIDFSPRALDRAALALADSRGVRVVRRLATYETGLDQCTTGGPGRTLAVFLGSNIGNCDPPEARMLLERTRAAVGAGGALLLGADLVKAEEQLRRAYADPLGVTAAFNRNLLVRINRELQADFDLSRFEHEARWNALESRVEMHLVAAARQQVHLEALARTIVVEPGETIWTENSYKYEPARIVCLLRDAGFATRTQWIDDDDRFALTLAVSA